MAERIGYDYDEESRRSLAALVNSLPELFDQEDYNCVVPFVDGLQARYDTEWVRVMNRQIFAQEHQPGITEAVPANFAEELQARLIGGLPAADSVEIVIDKPGQV